MSPEPRNLALIESLADRLTPVRRLWPPWLRTLGWLLAVSSIAVLLLIHYGPAPMLRRWAGAPDLAWAAAGAVLTTLCAAWAAFALGIPGRSRAWAWLPLPGALLWIGASGMGCLRSWLAPGTRIATIPQSADCLVFIFGFSIPLAALMIWLLRRACPLRPVLAAMLAGLASASASASLLEICHAYDAAATDLLAHALAVGIVIGANAVMGGQLLSGHWRAEGRSG
jgi:hypothetical protein